MNRIRYGYNGTVQTIYKLMRYGVYLLWNKLELDIGLKWFCRKSALQITVMN